MHDPTAYRAEPSLGVHSNAYDWQMVYALREIADELRAIRELLANPPREVELTWVRGLDNA